MAQDYKSPADQFQPIAAPSGGNDNEKVRQTHSRYEEASGYKNQFAKDWPRYYLLYTGKHWDGSQEEWQATPVINLTFSVIQTIVPILTDSRPQISVVPRQPENENIASVLGSLLLWLWEDCDMDVILPMVMIDAMIFGSGFVKVIWDPSVRGGLGDIRIIPVDPVNIFIAPHARRLEDAQYIIHAENMPAYLAERLYPQYQASKEDNMAGPSNPELSVDRSATNQSAESAESFRVQNTTETKTWTTRGGLESYADKSGLVSVFETWERDRKGRMTQTVVINNDLIFEKRAPMGHNYYPIIQFVDNPHNWTVWAMGEVQQVERLQIEINRRRGHILDILNYTAHPILVFDETVVGDIDSLDARPGLQIKIAGGIQSVGWLQAPQVPSALFAINQLDKQDFDTILGNMDAMRGQRPPGIEAGVAIENLQEAANTRMRQKVRYMENSIRKLGQVLIPTFQHFYDTERMFRIAGSETMALEKPLTQDQFLTINQPVVARIGAEGSIEARFRNRIPKIGEAEFDVRVGAGSTLPVSKSLRFAQMLQLYQMQVVDDVAVLSNSGIPRWQEVLLRSRQYWGLLQQAKMIVEQAQQAKEAEASEDAALNEEITESTLPIMEEEV